MVCLLEPIPIYNDILLTSLGLDAQAQVAGFHFRPKKSPRPIAMIYSLGKEVSVTSRKHDILPVDINYGEHFVRAFHFAYLSYTCTDS